MKVSKHTKPDWSLVISLFALVVSVGALGVSILDAKAARLHDRLSVRPILGFQLVGVPVEDWSEPGIHLVNNGNGVALIESLTVYVDGKPVQPAEPSAGLVEAARALGLENLDWPVTYATRFSGALPAGQTWLLIGMEKGIYTPERGAVLNGALAHVGIRIKYRSLYGDAYESELTQP